MNELASAPARSRSHHDVIVVGARCAGASVARLLAQRGHDVLVLDRAAFPSDTLSTHGLARGGVVQLARWGLLGAVLAGGAPAVRQVTFGIEGAERTRALRPSAGVDLLLAPRRHTLDALLLTSAQRAGATVESATSLTDVLRGVDGSVTGVRTRSRDGVVEERTARLVIGADGLRSTTAPLFGARTQEAFAADVSIYYLYARGLADRGFEFHVAPGGFAGVFPTNDGESCVWLSRPSVLHEPVRTAGAHRPSVLLAGIAEVAPGLHARLLDAQVAGPVKGVVAPPNYLRQAAGPGWALVGDAGYHRDPVTGHGMTDAFRDAEVLADVTDQALRGHLGIRAAMAAYADSRDRAAADVFRITRELTAFPEPARFVELEIELGEVLDREALDLASRPAFAGTQATTAA